MRIRVTFRNSFAQRKSRSERPRLAALITLPDAHPIYRSGLPSLDNKFQPGGHATQLGSRFPMRIPVTFRNSFAQRKSRSERPRLAALITLPDAHPIHRSRLPSLVTNPLKLWSRPYVTVGLRLLERTRFLLDMATYA